MSGPHDRRDVRAVLFDFGGVILSSPIDAFRSYEREMQLRHHSFR